MQFGWEENPARSLIANPFSKQSIVYRENMVAIEMRPYHIHQNRPILAGFFVLEILKAIFYGFYYDIMKVHFSTKEMELSYCDTDSLVLVIFDRDSYEFVKEYPEFFDTSKFSEKNRLGIQRRNANLSDLFKVETGDDIKTHFVGLRPKVYSYSLNCHEEYKLCKGIKKNVIDKKMRFQHYLDCLFEHKI